MFADQSNRAAIALALAGWIVWSFTLRASDTYFGEDVSRHPIVDLTRVADPNNDVPRPDALPNSTLAATRFLSRLSGAAIETFESFAANETPEQLRFNTDTATLRGMATVLAGNRTDTYHGVFPLSGTQTLLLDANQRSFFEIEFDAPQAAFGFYGTDVEFARLQLTLITTLETRTTFQIPVTVPQGSGGAFFFGVIDPDNPFIRVEFSRTGLQGDGFGFDDMTIARRDQVIGFKVPPKVSLTTPANGAKFTLGTNIPISAEAGDSDGRITTVELYANGSLIGTLTNAPFSLLWTNASEGLFALTARAIDNSKLSATSAPVNISVVRPVNRPPTVVILNPRHRSVFPPGADITINATASDEDGTIRDVVFYVGTTPIGTNTIAPYTVSWRNVPVGDYVLTAKATDNEGLIATSAPVSVVVTKLSGDVAIVRAIDDPEVGTLQDYLVEMGLSSVVLDQESASFDALQPFQLVIWHGSGAANALLKSTIVESFQQLAKAGKPLYFIGEKLTSVPTALNELQRTEWSALTHLKANGGIASPDTIIIGEVEDRQHPVLHGGFGDVQSFSYSQAIESSAAIGGDVSVLGRAGTSDMFVVSPADLFEQGEKTVTQNFSVTTGDETSRLERKKLFQNSVCWLLHCRTCTAFNLTFDLHGPEQRLRVGDLVTFTNVVRHSGECELTGVVVTNLLAPWMKFVSANSTQGTWRYDGNLPGLIFEIGRMTSASAAETTFTLAPVAEGVITQLASVQASGGRALVSARVTTVVQGFSRPTWSVGSSLTGQSTLRLSGEPGKSLRVQTSTDLQTWLDLTNVSSGVWTIPLQSTSTPNALQRFYRAVSP